MDHNLLLMNCRTFRKIAICVFFLSVLASGRAQGLFKIYPDMPYGGDKLELLPSGNYRLVNMNLYYDSYSGVDRGTRFYESEITPGGTALSGEHFLFGYYTWRLPDASYLRFETDWVISGTNFNFIKSHGLQDTLWSLPVEMPQGGDFTEWMAVDQNEAGEIFVVGLWFDLDGPTIAKFIVLKITADGTLLSQSTYQITPPGVYYNDLLTRLQCTPDGGCMLALTQFGANYATNIIKIGPDQSIQWVIDVPPFNDLLVTPDGGCIIATGQYTQIKRLNALGETQWLTQDLFFPNGTNNVAVPVDDGGFVIFGCSSYQTGAVKIDSNGTIQWKRTYRLRSEGQFYIQEGQKLANGDLLWTGRYTSPDTAQTGPFLIRMDSNGVIFKNHLAGRIAYDENVDCAVQPNENAMPGWVFKMESAGTIQYGTTDADGHYAFSEVDTGAVSLTPLIQNYLWEGCAPVINGYVPPDSSDYTLQLDVPIQAVGECPVLTVDLAAPFLRRCFDNNYALKCCNYGNASAEDAYAEVILPPHLWMQSASHPYSQSGQTLTFPLGTLDPFECVDIHFIVIPDCDSTELGESMCLSARIWPDSICAPIPGWSGALIEVSAACDGDSVRFLLENIGNVPTSPSLNFIVIDDHVMSLSGEYALAEGGQKTLAVPADGSTWRLTAEQEPNAPGAQMPSVAVEACVGGQGGPFNTGFVVQWPNENGSPFADRDCHVLVGAFDPNDKQAAPLGVDAAHFIYPNNPIEYLIQFQNTGTDTAFTVVLRDTVSSLLDAGSVRPGASSHPYTWSLSGAGILTFTFDNILLPDSNVNEAASRGFVQFTLQQQAELPDGTLLENRAGIYFDFNDPVITNTVFHTVGRDFLPTVETLEATQAKQSLLILPTPASGAVTAMLPDPFLKGGFLRLYDAFGRVQQTVYTQGASVEISRNKLPGGVYWLLWNGENGRVYSGKVVWN